MNSVKPVMNALLEPNLSPLLANVVEAEAHVRQSASIGRRRSVGRKVGLFTEVEREIFRLLTLDDDLVLGEDFRIERVDRFGWHVEIEVLHDRHEQASAMRRYRARGIEDVQPAAVGEMHDQPCGEGRIDVEFAKPYEAVGCFAVGAVREIGYIAAVLGVHSTGIVNRCAVLGYERIVPAGEGFVMDRQQHTRSWRAWQARV